MDWIRNTCWHLALCTPKTWKRLFALLTNSVVIHSTDPLITLVAGGRPDQGRVEIYHNGLWGALCHRDLTHVEADLICRHLGFRGGISAGPGHFGSGAGTSWTFNASCLATPQCAVVTNSEDAAQCSHELDAGVICGKYHRSMQLCARCSLVNDTAQCSHGLDAGVICGK